MLIFPVKYHRSGTVTETFNNFPKLYTPRNIGVFVHLIRESSGICVFVADGLLSVRQCVDVVVVVVSGPV